MLTCGQVLCTPTILPHPQNTRKNLSKPKLTLGRLQNCVFRQLVLNPSKNWLSTSQFPLSSFVRCQLVNSLVVVFKSSCPDFQNLAWLRNQLSKFTVASCRARLPQLVLSRRCLKGRESRSHTSFITKRHSGSHATVPLIKRGAGQRRQETRSHTAQGLYANRQ